MRDLPRRNQRDEDDFEVQPAPRTMTPRAARTPSSRRASLSALTSGAAAAAAAAAAAQGSFVTSFAMAREEQVAYLEIAKSHLPRLVAECARADNASGGDGGAQWRRLKSKKKSDAIVWEKGSDVSVGSGNSGGGGRSKSNSGAASTPQASAGVDHDDFVREVNTSTLPPPQQQQTPLYAVRSAVRVPAPLDVVLKTLDCSAVTTYRSFTKIIYESLVADTSVLFHSQSAASPTGAGVASAAATASPCAPSESLAVRWMVCRCNNPMVSDCDLCLLEYAKVTSVDDAPPRFDGKPLFTIRAKNNSNNNNNNNSHHYHHRHHQSTTSSSSNDNNNNNYGGGGGGSDSGISRSNEGLHDRREFPSAYKILCSIETKSCPELLDSHRIARAVVPLGGFLFYPTDNVDFTDVVFYMSIALGSAGASSGNPFSSGGSSERQFRAMQRVLQHMARGVGRIKNAVDAYTMSLRLEMLRNTRWVRNTERAECVVCYRRFHQLTRRRHHCRLCGDVICRDCSVYKDADLPTIGPTVLRICKLCDLNELKGSAGSAAAAATSAVAAAAAASASTQSSQAARGGEPAPAFAKPLTRKRSTTLNVDTTKEAVLAAQQEEPDVGRRFTTVVDGKHRRELPDQAFSCSKADIVNRGYKWNTGGGGGKPLVILSPTSAALYASRTGGGGGGGGAASRPFARAMTPTGKKSAAAPQDWRAAVHPASHLPGASVAATAQPSSNQSQFQAKSCSKAHDRNVSFETFTFRDKGSAVRDPAALNQEGEREREEHGGGFAGDASAVWHHAARVVKSGKLIVPGQELVHSASPHAQGGGGGDGGESKRNEKDKKSKPKKRTPPPPPPSALSDPEHETKAPASNQHRDARTELTPRKLQRVDEYEDILLALCEQVSKALDCKYAAVSIFTSPTAPVGGAAQTRGGRSLPPSPTPSSALETVHFLKAAGSRKLGKVAASLMCCAPVLELREKLITRDALGHCNMFDFKRLPIVIGPQQVRFYAGIPLVDSSGQMLGAFAVFDSSVYRGHRLAGVLPSMEAFASVALSAIEDRKTDLDLKSFLRHPLVDTSRGDNQAARGSDPLFHIDMDLHAGGAGRDSGSDADGLDFDDEVDFEYPASSGKELLVSQSLGARPSPLQFAPSPAAAEAARGVEYFKRQMEQLVRQARETEAQMLETSMAMKRQGVAIW